MAKDINRYSFSRFKTFHQCPRRHYYQYIEQIPTADSMTAMPGKIFHEAVAMVLTNEDPTPKFKEFEALCLSGKIEMDPKLMESVVREYFAYYADEFAQERCILVEHTITEPLEDEDNLIVVIDEVFEKAQMTFLRDRKTSLSSFKYDMESVKSNQQMLLYVPYAEKEIQNKIDGVQIDEIRLAMLEPVPVNNNGKPSTDKRRLTNVTYEAYYEYLEGMGLEDDKVFKEILEYLEQRGHPLFRRTTHQLLDPNQIDTNIADMWNTYETMKTFKVMYRIRGPLCDWCPFKELCDLDMFNPTEVDRDVLKQKIISGK
jgi:hypothetical protein